MKEKYLYLVIIAGVWRRAPEPQEQNEAGLHAYLELHADGRLWERKTQETQSAGHTRCRGGGVRARKARRYW